MTQPSGAGTPIDRYVYDVVRRLPKEQRTDIERELRGLIDDMLEGTFRDEDAVNQVLLNLGNPANLARQYRDEESYVVGPENYETYRLVLKIVLICVLAGFAVSAVVGLLADGNVASFKDGARFFGRTIAEGLVSLVTAFGFVTLIFAVMDRQKVRLEQKSTAAWTPDSLPPVPDRRALIKRGDTIVEIVFTLIFGGILLFAPQLFGAWTEVDGQLVAIPIFNLDIWHITMPLMLLGIGIGLIEGIAKLIIGRYTFTVALFNAASGLANLFIAVILLKFLPFLNPSFAADMQAAFDWASYSSGDILAYWNTPLIANILLAVIAVATLIDIGVTTYRAVKYSESAV